ncbi:MAG TPA: hypothetical protein ENN66_01660 [Proteobacteria bacterium]|mgnify:CR=1 FL=1|nr:hypothetical protein [Pseudomonadota bacterium]
MSRYGGWAPYVPVAVRRANAIKKMAAKRKKGLVVEGIEACKGRKIAGTFWGSSWCEHLEAFRDFANRLPRGKTCLRNGSVVHLGISKGEVEAYVAGSGLHKVEIKISTLPKYKWAAIKRKCTGRISSLVELLQGRFSDEVMAVVTNPGHGLFPLKGEISFVCSCPDSAGICKHVAAVFYGIGKRLDARPELLFKLRGVDSGELVDAEALASATSGAVVEATSSRRGASRRRLDNSSLGDIFGVEIDETAAKPENLTGKTTRKTTRAAANKPVEKPAEKSAPAVGKTRPPDPAGHLTSNRLAAGRRQMKLSVAAFAEKVGVTAATVYNWERKPGQLTIRDGKTEKRLISLLKNVAWPAVTPA